MSARNEDRMPGAKVPVSDSPLEVVSGLNFTTPTEFVELPSRGKYYPEDHPLHQQETIEIRHMTSKEEDILSSQSLLKNGTAIDKLLQSVIVNKKIKVDSLFVGDKNALVVATRISGYGSDYETSISCPSCGETSKHEFDLESLKTRGEVEIEGVSLTDNNTILITLPKTKLIFEVRLMTGADEKWLTSYWESKKKKKLPETLITDQMKRYTVSINGETNSAQISEVIDMLPSLDSKWLRTMYQRTVPNVDMTQTFVCEKCGSEQEVSVPFTADFFWPDR